MADNIKLTAEEIIELRRLITELNGAIDDVSFNNLINSGPAAKKVLSDLRKEYKDWTSDISDSRSQFQKLADQMKNTKSGVSEVSKVYKGLNSIAKDIQYHQKGITELDEKGAKNLQEKLQKQRQELVNASSLLEHEQEQLETKKSLKETDQLALLNEIKRLELRGRNGTLTKDEKQSLKEYRKEYQTLGDDIGKINDEIKEKNELQNEIQGIIKEEDANYKQIVNTLNVITTQQENLRKATGLTGAAVDGIGKAFNKIGLGGLSSAMGLDKAKEKMREVAEDVTNGGDKAAGLVGQFKILGAGLKVIGSNMFKHLTDPLTIITGLVAGITAGIKGLISLFEETAKFNGDIAKTFGVSAAESSKIGDNLRNAAGSDFFMNNEQARKAFDIMANASGVINSNFSDPKAVSAMNDLVTYAGRSVEASEGLFRMGKLNNMEADDMEKSLRGQLTLLQKNNKLRINESQAVEMVAKASATVRMNLGSNPKKLADAAFYASKLGMSLDEIASAAEQTLNFESAIQNQLEYQVLTGKEINIDAYQQAAASGDAAKAAEEMNRILEEQGDSVKGNFFAQEALAKTLGISREQMMKSLEFQKVQKKVGGDIAEIEKAINAEMAKGLTLEEASAKVGEKSYESIVKQNKNAAVFSNTVSQIKESFMNALAGSEGFQNLFTKENIDKYVKTIQEDIIPAVIKLAKLAGEFIEYLTKPETKEFIKGLINNLGTVAKVLGAIILINFAGKFIGNITSIGKAVGGLISRLGKAGSLMTGLGKSKIPSATPSPTPPTPPTPGASPSGKGGVNGFTKGINANAMLKGAAAVLVLSAALYVAAKAFKEFGGVKWEDVAKGTAALGGLTIAALALGKIKGKILEGALAIGILGASLIPAAFALKMFSEVSWEDMGKAGVVLVGLGVAGAAFGSLAPLMLTGALAIGALGASLLPLAAALRLAAPGLESFGKMIKSVLEGIVPVIKTAGEAIKGIFESIGSVIESTGKSISGVITSIADSIVKLSSINAANLFATAGGITALGVALTAFGGGGVLAGLGSAIGKFFDEDPVEKFNRFANIEADKLLRVVDAITALKNAISNFGDATLKIGDTSDIEKTIAKLIDLHEEFDDTPLEKVVNVAATGVSSLFDKVSSFASSIFSSKSTSPSYAPLETNINRTQSINNNKTSSSVTTTNNNVTDNSQVIAAINRLTEAITSNSSKEITLVMNGQEVGQVLIPVMTPGIVRQINNTSVLV
jgi:hypothetical protein